MQDKVRLGLLKVVRLKVKVDKVGEVGWVEWVKWVVSSWFADKMPAGT